MVRALRLRVSASSDCAGALHRSLAGVDSGVRARVGFQRVEGRGEVIDVACSGEKGRLFFLLVTAAVLVVFAADMPTALGANDAAYVSQNVPGFVAAGQSYAVAVTFENVGTSIWSHIAQPSAVACNLGSQNPQDNTTWGVARVPLTVGNDTAPGETETFVFTITAPAVPGRYGFQWQMVEDNVGSFGELSPNIDLLVSDTRLTCVVQEQRPLPSPFVWSTAVALGDLTPHAGNELVRGGATDYYQTPIFGKLFAYSAVGQVVWEYAPPGSEFVMGVDIGDTDDDGDNEVAVGYRYRADLITEARGELLDHNGGFLWSHTFTGTGRVYVRTAQIGDLVGGPGGEVLFGTSQGQLALLDSVGGVIWEKTICPCNFQNGRIADLDGDGQKEIILAGGWGTHNNLRVLDEQGDPKWSTMVGLDAMGVAVGDLIPARPGLEIGVASAVREGAADLSDYANRASLVGKDGDIIRQLDFGKASKTKAWSAVTGDVDGDGTIELLIGYGNHDVEPPSPALPPSWWGGVAVIDGDGNIAGELQLPGSVKAIDFGDANNDGNDDIVASCDDGSTYIARCCTPDCTGRECGTDGCFGVCGNCPDNATCEQGQCACTFVSCGGECCSDGQICYNSACCTPTCAGRVCGSDGCGGICGSCDNPPSDSCVDSSTYRSYDPIGICNSGQCQYSWNDTNCSGGCSDDTCLGCVPTTCAQEGKDCGVISDYCGGTLSCGTCIPPDTCGGSGASNVCGCTPHTCALLGYECGTWDDGCGQQLECATCPSGEHCDTDGQCAAGCVPDCSEVECGDDGCGATCGECSDGEVCTSEGACEALPPVDGTGCTCRSASSSSHLVWALLLSLLGLCRLHARSASTTTSKGP